jgi:hemoglobin
MRNPLSALVLTAALALASSAHGADSAAPPTPQPAAASLPAADAFFTELGGKDGIREFTHTFMGLITTDPRIKDKFEDADLDRLEGLLAEQFCDLSGGPCHYSGRDMRAVHAHRDITSAQFNALAEDLQIAMEQHNVPSSAANRLIAKLAPMHRDVVTK